MKKMTAFSPTLETKYVDANLWEKIQNLNLQLIVDRMIIKHGWTTERTEKAVEGYSKYLYMTQMFDQPITPTGDVDAIWHEHILHTNKYAADCEKLFGSFLHHFPTPAKWTKSEIISNLNANCQGTTNCGNDKPSDCSCSGTKRSMDYDNPLQEDVAASVNFEIVKNRFFLS